MNEEKNTIILKTKKNEIWIGSGFMSVAIIERKEKTNHREHEKIHGHIHRGDIYMCDLSGVEGQIQRGIRPCLIISNSIGNKHSNIVVVAPISTSTTKNKIPTHVELLPENTGLVKKSILLAEQIRTLDQWCVMYKVGRANDETMKRVNKAIAISLGLDSYIK